MVKQLLQLQLQKFCQRVVEQNLLHENDEVFIGDLEENTTKFIRIKTLDIPNEINLHLSGLSRGEPVAAVPTKSTPALSEE